MANKRFLDFTTDETPSGSSFILEADSVNGVRKTTIEKAVAATDAFANINNKVRAEILKVSNNNKNNNLKNKDSKTKVQIKKESYKNNESNVNNINNKFYNSINNEKELRNLIN